LTHHFREAWCALVAAASLSLFLFGVVSSRYGRLWELQAIGSAVGCFAAVVSVFTTKWFYGRIAAMAGPFFARAALYAVTPDVLHGHGGVSAATSNLMLGVSVVILEATWIGSD